MNLRTQTLENGLEIIAEINPDALSLAVGFFVRSGSRDEKPDLSGCSHYLEHMAFKGSSTRSAVDLSRDFDRLGAKYNAYTGEEHTVFYAAALPERQDAIVELTGDLLQPVFRQDDFDTEKNVILEEIALYEDQPRRNIFHQALCAHFASHPSAIPCLEHAAALGPYAGSDDGVFP